MPDSETRVAGKYSWTVLAIAGAFVALGVVLYVAGSSSETWGIAILGAAMVVFGLISGAVSTVGSHRRG